jgi:2-iminobutanoate/2-iminopropanoate deaminase
LHPTSHDGQPRLDPPPLAGQHPGRSTCSRRLEIEHRAMSRKRIVTPQKSPPAIGPYSHAVRCGEFLFCSGQIPVDPANPNLAIAGDIRTQTTRVLENIKILLEDQGLTFAQVVKSTVFLTSLDDFAAMNEVYARYFSADYPARSTVQVAALPRSARVEIEVIAHYSSAGDSL